MKPKFTFMITSILATLLLTACAGNAVLGAESNSAQESVISSNIEDQQAPESAPEDPITNDESTVETARPAGWDDGSHGKESEPNYAVVFPQDEVKRMDITISPENWQVMMNDMTTLFGDFGANPRGPGAEQGALRRQNQSPADGQPPPEGQPPNGVLPPDGGQLPKNGDQVARPGNGLPNGGARMEGDDHNPTWVPVTIEFEGGIWTYVGLRFKGNSSLFSSWSSGNYKLPLKLDFDEFEDKYPEVDDQRFYGFKQLSLSSNFHDDSFLREKVTADIFREAGVPAAQTAFYQIYVDYGEGPVYFGLYTMVEVIDDTVIETQFEDDSGNVYKPSGSGATFAAGSFTEDDFDKETNEDEGDYNDIKALYSALHAETRTSNPTAWRTNLESIFDVDGFLKWLAVNTVIQNWDTYGIMQHNYYLYHDPTTDLLTWIPWDNNEALKEGNMRNAVSISLDEVTEEWPLIRYLMDDPTYQAKYTESVKTLINGVFNPDTIIPRYQAYHEMIRAYVVGSEGEIEGYTHLQSGQAFDAALEELIRHAQKRYQAASEYLAKMK